jgi:PleD family two-component response regulator
MQTVEVLARQDGFAYIGRTNRPYTFLRSAWAMTHCLFARPMRRWCISEIFSERHNAQGTKVRSHSPNPRCSMPSILVVDDETQISRLVRETLEQAGYHVTEARDGTEALQQYRLAPADLVIRQ